MLTGILSRFWLGAAAGAVAALAAFGLAAFVPGEPAFESLSLVLLLAGLLALVRAPRRVEALVVVGAYGLLRLALGGWQAGLGALGVGLGALVVTSVYDELGQAGVRFGKFLIVGPLLGGACFAVAPLTMYAEIGRYDSLRPLMLQLFLGIVVGDGVGFGVELAELLPWTGRRPVTQEPAATARAPGIHVVEPPAESVD